MRLGLVCVALAGGILATACGGHASAVRADDAALGRVVIYRNGVAYYERRAQIDKEQLTVTVPQDKVDDFLKSLTVLDAATGEPLPVAFPRHRSSEAGMIDMTIQLPEGKAAHDVVLTYITAAPAWKPSYRVVVGEGGKVLLQGWAIVDNTSGEDWKDVVIGVGSSSALSFRYDLWSIRDVHRTELQSEERFAAAPPTGVSPYGESAGEGKAVLSELSDADIPQDSYGGEADEEALYETVVTEASGGATYGTSTGASAPSPDRGYRNKPAGPSREEIATRQQQRRTKESEERERRQRNMRLISQQVRGQSNVVVIEGYADAHEGNPEHRALERANALRNQLIEDGVPPAQVRVEVRGVVSGQGAGVKVVATDEVLPGGNDPGEAATSDTPVGESHFQSETPMTVERGSSVMVSVVKKETDGEVVYLYDPESARGNARYAFKAVRFRNPTESTLETGPVTVYGDGRFIGEGLAEPIPPSATAVVPFALDRQVVVSRENDSRDRISSLVTLERGIVTADVQHLRTTSIKMTNRLRTPISVFVRHTVHKGWELADAPEVYERIGTSYLFQVELAASETRVVAIEEATPMVKTIDLNTRAGLDLVEIYLNEASPSEALTDSVKKLSALHREMADTAQAIGSWHERLREYRVRMDELHDQVLSLKEAKAKGKLMKHLEQKLEDVSERVHQATLEVVTLEETLMMSRIRFQDAVAELTLEDRLARN